MSIHYLLAKAGGRSGVMALIALGHAGLLYALTQWGGSITRLLEPAPIEVVMLEEARPDAPDWKPPSVDMLRLTNVPTRPDLPMVDVSPLQEASNTAISVQERPTAAESRPQQAPPPLVTQVDYVRAPSPQYPHLSRRLREQGLVVLKVLVDEKGRARDIAVHQSSGFGRLDEAAREAVARAEFKPYLQGGQARAALVLIPIEFALNQSFAQR